MNQEAIAIVQKCLETQDPYLDLGRLGLTDEDFAEGTELDKLLRQCTHLETLVLSNEWDDWNGIEWGKKTSKNNNSANYLTVHPAAILQLTNLRVLICGGDKDQKWGIKSMAFVARFVNLDFLYLACNQIVEITGLENLIKLKKLDLGINQIAELRGLEKLGYLVLLELNSNKITEIMGLEALSQLLKLHLSSNQIREIRGLEGLSSLEQLDLNSNEIYEIRGLEGLSSLERLDLSSNEIYEIRGLKGLSSLKQLDISYNHISEISGLEGLFSLQELRLSYNQISEVRGLDDLSALEKLDISKNNITNISALLPWIERAANPLQTALKDYSYNFEKGEINIYGNPLQTPPMEVVERGKEAVLRYFSEALEPAYEAKLLVVGEPEAGKTSLIKKLVDPTYPIPNEEDSTIGIQVLKWDCAYKSIPRPVKLNVWDFGGQEMQYLTHQFFLSSDALYILLTSARKDLDNLDYWFNIISLLGKNENKQNSELLVVANEIKMQEGQTGKTFDVKKYQDLYPHLPFAFHAVNLTTSQDGDGRFATLQHLIKKKLVNLPVMGRQLPVKWGVARQQLANSNINYISINDYIELCKKVGVEEKFALDLSNYLHKIGEAVHFQSDHTVNNFVILNPKWAVDGIYSILKRKEIEANGGHFTQQQVYTIWDNEGYSFGEKGMLLNLMVKDSFEVAYKIPGKAEEYIAPQLLPLVQPEYKWNKADAMHFRYLYPFMPKGIVTRLIVRLHEDIKYQDGKGLVWRSGAIFEKLGCTAKVEETKILATGQQVIAIAISGHVAHRKLLLYDICRTIEGIHKDAFSKIVFERQVPCCCSHCQILEQPGFFDYSELMQYIDDEIDKIRCKLKPKNEVEITAILKGIFKVDFMMLNKDAYYEERISKRNTIVSEDPFSLNKPTNTMKKLFISYSKYDEEYKEEFRKHLVTLKEQKLISSFNCKEIDLGADWDETIQRELDECDMVICLVSVDFLNTDYIRKYEVDKAMSTGKQVIPIIIKPCDWENSNIGKLFAPNRGKNISLDQELFLRNIIKETTPIERAAWWVAIVKEMREKLFK